MKKVLAFSGSSSTDSINHTLIEHAVKRLSDNVDCTIVRLGDHEAPIYTKEREQEHGIPSSILQLRRSFDRADGFIISTPEYNSSIPAGLKNTVDWLSRMEGKVFQQKPVLLMAATPGKRGGRSVLAHLSQVMPFWGAQLSGTFSLPEFNVHYQNGQLDEPFSNELQLALEAFEGVL